MSWDSSRLICRPLESFVERADKEAGRDIENPIALMCNLTSMIRVVRLGKSPSAFLSFKDDNTIHRKGTVDVQVLTRQQTYQKWGKVSRKSEVW
jgi:hypothetical protein